MYLLVIISGSLNRGIFLRVRSRLTDFGWSRIKSCGMFLELQTLTQLSRYVRPDLYPDGS
jgi:hypothetical protein